MKSIIVEIADLARQRNDLCLKVRDLEYRAGRYPFLRIASKEIRSEDKVMMLAAGIHGEEISGPLTFARHFQEIVDYVQDLGLKLIIYPARNPSGILAKTRFNADLDEGDAGNNDCFRYLLPSGELTDEIEEGQGYLCWKWADELGLELPLEAKCLIDSLKRDPLSQVVAGIDLHQDYLSGGLPPCAYHYAFGNLEKYAPIVREIAKKVPILKNYVVSAGYSLNTGKPTDENGFIVRHDGTIMDLWHRLDVPYSITPETSGRTPLDLACAVNLEWIKGIARLCKR